MPLGVATVTLYEAPWALCEWFECVGVCECVSASAALYMAVCDWMYVRMSEFWEEVLGCGRRRNGSRVQVGAGKEARGGEKVQVGEGE